MDSVLIDPSRIFALVKNPFETIKDEQIQCSFNMEYINKLSELLKDLGETEGLTLHVLKKDADFPILITGTYPRNHMILHKYGGLIAPIVSGKSVLQGAADQDETD